MLRVENYTAGYADNQFLFKELSFELKPSQVVCVTGLNGSGKSSFIKGLLNFAPYKKGKVILDEDEISRWTPSAIFQEKSIAYLSQRDRVFPHLTVGEHIRLYRSYAKKKEQDKVETLLSNFFVSHNHTHKLGSTLSGGEQLLLGLLCVAILNTDYVFLDEPSDSLDVSHQEFLEKVLTYWKLKREKGLLVVEQNTEVLRDIVDTNLVIGRV